MNKSIFAYPHIYNGKHYVVLTLKRRIFEVEKDVYSALTNGAIDDLSHHKDFKKMCDLGILVEDGIDEVQCLEDAFCGAMMTLHGIRFISFQQLIAICSATIAL